MASRPSRISTTYSWRLSGSSGPRPRIWALGGLVRPVQKYKFLENALMPGRTVTHGGVRTPESAGRPRRPGVKTQGTVECFPRIAVVPVGGGRPQSVSITYPDVRGCQPSAPASLRSPGDCLHVAVAVRLRPGDRRAVVDDCRGRCRDERFPRLSPDPRHGRYAPSDRGLRAPCTRRPRLTRSQTRDFCVSEKDLAETG